MSLDWAGFLFWASALEELGQEPPLPLFGVMSPRSTPTGCRFMPFFAEAAFAAVTIAYLSSVYQTPRNFFTTDRAVPSCHGRSCLLMKSSFRLSMSVPCRVVVACGIAGVVNRPEDDHYEVLAVVLYALHLLLDVPCVELWDIIYFVLEEDVALLLRYSKRILCYMRLELPQVTIAVGVLF